MMGLLRLWAVLLGVFAFIQIVQLSIYGETFVLLDAVMVSLAVSASHHLDELMRNQPASPTPMVETISVEESVISGQSDVWLELPPDRTKGLLMAMRKWEPMVRATVRVREEKIERERPTNYDSPYPLPFWVYTLFLLMGAKSLSFLGIFLTTGVVSAMVVGLVMVALGVITLSKIIELRKHV